MPTPRSTRRSTRAAAAAAAARRRGATPQQDDTTAAASSPGKQTGMNTCTSTQTRVLTSPLLPSHCSRTAVEPWRPASQPGAIDHWTTAQQRCSKPLDPHRYTTHSTPQQAPACRRALTRHRRHATTSTSSITGTCSSWQWWSRRHLQPATWQPSCTSQQCWTQEGTATP